MTLKKVLIAVAMLALCPMPAARGYIDRAPTLARVMRDSQKIVLVEVDKFNREKGAVILKKVRDLKGESNADAIKHQLMNQQGGNVPQFILEWAEPGRRAVLFVGSNTAAVCVGRQWYQVQASADGWWQLGPERPDLPLAFCGPVSRLADAIPVIQSGKIAVITTVPHGAEEGASFDLALNRPNLPGLVRVQRIRASLQMPQSVMAVSANPAYVVGQGPVGEQDIPALMEKLRSADATVRADAADDLRSLGRKAGDAVAALTRLLEDPSPMVQVCAAAALMRITPKDARPSKVLSSALAGSDVSVRRAAARATGLAGPAAATLSGKLAELLCDPDELTRVAALQAISTLGPNAAAAMDAVVKLLDDPQMAADAADALGRMGQVARPAVKRLAQLLLSPSVSLRWAAVRGMSQIGGEDAMPAVDFMIQQLRNPSEVNCYNMMIYLGLLGPVAQKAIPAMQSAPVMPPPLRAMALWAIEPEDRIPWLSGGMGMGGSDVEKFIFDTFFDELSDRYKPAARVLAQRIMAGTAGQMPQWGYKVLARFPGEVIEVISPSLADQNIVKRERAAVTLGYMGPAAAATKPRVAEALRNAPTEREQRLIKWCLREISVTVMSDE